MVEYEVEMLQYHNELSHSAAIAAGCELLRTVAVLTGLLYWVMAKG